MLFNNALLVYHNKETNLVVLKLTGMNMLMRLHIHFVVMRKQGHQGADLDTKTWFQKQFYKMPEQSDQLTFLKVIIL